MSIVEFALKTTLCSRLLNGLQLLNVLQMRKTKIFCHVQALLGS